MNEMRDLVKQADFPKQCIFRNRQIKMIDAQRQQLKTQNFKISGAGELVSGYYDEITSDHCKGSNFEGMDFAGNHNCGAMGYIWKKNNLHRFTDTDDDSSVTLKVAAVNCYGSAWEIYSCAETDDGEEAELSKCVLYKWDNGIFTSLVPPQFDWEKVEDDETCVKSEMYIDYSFARNPHY